MTRIGFLDFLRDLQEENALAPNRTICVEGLEDVLLNARPDVEALAHEIRCTLQRHASRLQDEVVANVYVLFRNPLERGDTLWVNTPAEHRLPIHLIFGSPPEEQLDGKSYYRASFNLSPG